MNNGIIELAKLFKERDNGDSYEPLLGTVTRLPNPLIQVGTFELDSDWFKSCINLEEQDEDGNYIYMNKTVVVLPYHYHQKFIVIGVLQDGNDTT